MNGNTGGTKMNKTREQCIIDLMIQSDTYKPRQLSVLDVNKVIDCVINQPIKNHTTKQILGWCSRQGSYRVDVVGDVIYIDGKRFV